MRHTYLGYLANAALCALAAAAAPAWATPDSLTTAAVCTPASYETIRGGLVLVAEGAVRAGRNPPVLEYICPVWNPEDYAASTSWQFLKLQYRDANRGGAAVRATLFEKSRASGRSERMLVLSSGQSAEVAVVAARLPRGLDFSRHAYYVLLELESRTLAPEAHMVMLTDK